MGFLTAIVVLSLAQSVQSAVENLQLLLFQLKQLPSVDRRLGFTGRHAALAPALLGLFLCLFACWFCELVCIVTALRCKLITALLGTCSTVHQIDSCLTLGVAVQQ
jgi:hypothetical protein